MLDVSIRIGILNLMLALKERARARLPLHHARSRVRRYVADDDARHVRRARSSSKGRSEQVLQDPLHPYTRLLLSSVPDPRCRPRRLETAPVRRSQYGGRRSGRRAVPSSRAARSQSRPARSAPRARRGPPDRARAARHRHRHQHREDPMLTTTRFPTASSGAPPPPRTRSRARPRGRPRREHLGPLLRDAWEGPERRQRARSPATTTTAFPEDIALMRELGLGAFRFSIAWPRVIPDGRGRVNEAGPRLLRPPGRRAARGRDPPVRHPLPLGSAAGARGRRRLAGARDRGGVRRVRRGRRRRLGDRVTHWITHNEPWVASWLGYGWGVHAPGRTSDADAVAAAHHLLLSHGWALPDPARDVARRRGRASRSI